MTPMQITARTRATLKFLWRMNRKKPVRRITQKNNFTGGICRPTYLNLKEQELMLIVLSACGQRNPQSGQLTQRFSVRPIDRMVIGRATVISSAGAWGTWWSWLHPMSTTPNTSSGALQICPSCRKGGSIWCLRPPKTVWHPAKLMHRPDVDSIVNSCDSGREGELIFRLVYQQAGCKSLFSSVAVQHGGICNPGGLCPPETVN